MPIFNYMEIIILILLGFSVFLAWGKYQAYISHKTEREYRREGISNSNWDTNDFNPSYITTATEKSGVTVRKQFSCEFIDMQTNRAMQRLDNYDTRSPKKLTASYAKQSGTLFLYSDNTIKYVPLSKKDSLLSRVISTSSPISFMTPEKFIETIVENYSLSEGRGIESNEVVSIAIGDKDTKTSLKKIDIIGKTNYTIPNYRVTIALEEDGETTEEIKYIPLAKVTENPHYEYNYKAGIQILPVEYVQELGRKESFRVPKYFIIYKAPNDVKYPETKHYYPLWLKSDVVGMNDSSTIEVFFLNQYDRQSFIEEYNRLVQN